MAKRQQGKEYVWTEELNASFWDGQQNQAGMTGSLAVERIRNLTGWPLRVCRKQAAALGLTKKYVEHIWPPELDAILIEGYTNGEKAKLEAIRKIQSLTGWPRYVCWSRAEKLNLTRNSGRKRWSPEEKDYLLNFVNAKNVRIIARRLKRSVGAVRKRVYRLGLKRKLSARVQDGYTKSDLALLLGCSEKTIQGWIHGGKLRARREGKNRKDDAFRIMDEDFRAFWKKYPHEVPLHRFDLNGLRWFCSTMFDIPPADNFGDPLDRKQRRLQRKQQKIREEEAGNQEDEDL